MSRFRDLSRFVVLGAACACVCACGADLPGNSPYAGAWTRFAFNGSQSLGGFQVDDHGRFNFQAGDAQLSGSIAPDGTVTGSAHSLSVPGSCVLTGRCTTLSLCAGSTAGSGCPADPSGQPWASFSLCRESGC